MNVRLIRIGIKVPAPLLLSLLTTLGAGAAGAAGVAGTTGAAGASPAHHGTKQAQDSTRYAAESARVTIIRDKWGVPHIYGKTDADVVFGLMYEECAHDFARVEKNYLEVMGRQQEAYGPGYLAGDLELQLIEDTADAIRDYHNSPAWMVRLLDAFADGVNFYLYRHPECKPAVLKHFEPWFPLMFTDGSVSATSTGGIRPDEVKQFYVHGSAIASAALPDEAPETGSNGFAISPGRTRDGHALLYINPHVPFYFRLEVHLVSEEGLNAYGAVTWGQFFVYQGFNAHCGWMHTSSYADVSDLYREQVRQDASGWRYRYDDQWLPVRTKTLRIRCKDGADTVVTAYYTGHGPVMGAREGSWLSLKENNRSMRALMEAWLTTKAGTFAQYKVAMDLRSNTTNNTVYADDFGNIAYWHGNFMPKRDPHLDWSQPVDGTTSATDWKGTYGPDEVVHVYNPSTGWIQNCNSTPFAVSGAASPHRADYPTYMAPDGQNFRSVNAIRLLENARNLTLDSLIAKGYNHYLSAFEVLLPSLRAAWKSAPDSIKEALQGPMAVLDNWNMYAADTSVATTLAVEWGTRMSKKARRPATMEQASNAVGTIQSEVDNASAEETIRYLREAIQELTGKFGTWHVPWGNVNRYQRLTGKIQETYDDSRSSIPVGFASSAFGSLPSFATRYMPGTQKRYGYSGNSFIAAVEFGPHLRAKTIATGGESSDPASPHFTDQAEGYALGRFKDVYFYKEDVLAHAEATYHPGEW
jgi:acyl-homoserine lactone acylase PvdQ